MYGTCRYSVRVDVIFAFSNLRRNIAKKKKEFDLKKNVVMLKKVSYFYTEHILIP